MTDIQTAADPVADLIAELRGQAGVPQEPVADAPYGFKADGTPKARPGRKKSPSLEELKASESAPQDEEDEDNGPAVPAADAPPSDRAPDERRAHRQRARGTVSRETIPAYRGGIIAPGVNRLYRRAGKIVRAMDSDIGTAIIESARNTAEPGEPDDSVGAAWDELCKTNPRIRRFVMKCLTGGAWAQLVMAHAPIGMAIVMKPAIFRLIPFQGVIASMAEPDEDTAPGEGGLPGGLTVADAAQMQQLAEQQMQRMGMKLDPEMAAKAAAFAANAMGGPVLVPPPPSGVSRETASAFVRHQPRRGPSRAARKSG
jgi:hypothetical protein